MSGYKTQLTIDPEGKKAYIVLINARGVTPTKYTRGIKNLMDQLQQRGNKNSNLFEEIVATINLCLGTQKTIFLLGREYCVNITPK